MKLEHSSERGHGTQTRDSHSANEAKWWRTPDWWIVLLTFFLAVFAAGSFVYLERQVNDARDFFEKDQRPYLWPSNMTPEEPTYNVSQKMKIRVSIANYGKSPAMKVSVFGNIIIGPNALEKTDAWFAKLGDKPPAETSPNETFLRPGTMPDGTGPMFNIVESERELTKEDALFIFSTKDRRDIGYVVVMRLFYTDISGNPYYADICSYSTTTRQLGACKKHNEVTAPYGLTARNEMKGKTFASWASAISGFVAAALWFGATLVTVKYKQRFTQSGPEPAIIERDDKTGEEKDFLYTAKRQTLWNRWAALFTAISMLCAAVSLLM